MKPASGINQGAVKAAVAGLLHGSAIEYAVPHLRDPTEADMQIGSILRQTSGVAGILATIALAFAIISFPYAVSSQRFASLPDATSPMAEALATVVPSAKNAGLIDPEVDQAFGFLVYDWDPRAQGGVPGFDRWISSTERTAQTFQLEIK